MKKPYGWRQKPPEIGTLVEFTREYLALVPIDCPIVKGEIGLIRKIWNECEWVTVETGSGKFWAGPFKELKVLPKDKQII